MCYGMHTPSYTSSHTLNKCKKERREGKREGGEGSGREKREKQERKERRKNLPDDRTHKTWQLIFVTNLQFSDGFFR